MVDMPVASLPTELAVCWICLEVAHLASGLIDGCISEIVSVCNDRKYISKLWSIRQISRQVFIGFEAIRRYSDTSVREIIDFGSRMAVELDIVRA